MRTPRCKIRLRSGRWSVFIRPSWSIYSQIGPFQLLFVSYTVAKGNRELLQLINTSLDWMD